MKPCVQTPTILAVLVGIFFSLLPPVRALDEAALQKEITAAAASLKARYRNWPVDQLNTVAERTGRSNYVARIWPDIVRGNDPVEIKAVLALVPGKLGDFSTRGSTLMRLAIEEQCLAAVELLLAGGVHPDDPLVRAPYATKQPCLHQAAYRGNVEIVKALLGAHATIDLLDKEKRTALVSLVAWYRSPLPSTPFSNELQQRRLEIARLLVAHGANLLVPVISYLNTTNTVIESAWQRHYDELSEVMLSHATNAAQLTAQAANGDSLLHIAIRARQPEVITSMLDTAIPLNATNHAGETPLQLVALWRMEQKQGTARRLSVSPFSSPTARSTSPDVQAIAGQLIVKGANLDVFSAVALGKLIEAQAWLRTRPALAAARDATGRTPLHWAVLSGDAAMVDLLISHGAPMDAVTESGNGSLTALHLAASGGHLVMVQRLAAAGADLNRRDANRATAMDRAISAGYDPIVTWLLSQNAAFARSGTNVTTPLHLAVAAGNFPMAQDFLKRGVDVAARDSRGKTALHLAAERGNLALIELLLKSGAKINAPDVDGNTVLHQAAAAGDIQVWAPFVPPAVNPMATSKIKAVRWFYQQLVTRGFVKPAVPTQISLVKYLLDHKANPSATNRLGQTPLHRLGEYSGSSTNELAAATFVLRELVKRGAQIEVSDLNGDTPLMAAARHHHPMIQEVLLDAGANPNQHGSQGDTAMHRAVTGGNRETNTIHLLLTRRADPHATNRLGQTPLHFAVLPMQDGYTVTPMVRLLLERGADSNARDVEGKTPLHFLAAIHREHVQPLPELIDLFRAARTDLDTRDRLGRTPVQLAAEFNHWQVAIALVNSGASLAATNAAGNTVLHEFAARDVNFYRYGRVNPNRLKSLPSLNQTNRAGETALHVALRENRSASKQDLIMALLDAGPDIGIKNLAGDTPLHFIAKYEENLFFLQRLPPLLTNSAVLNATDANGDTAAHIAFRNNNQALGPVLIGANPNLTIRNLRGETPRALAILYYVPMVPGSFPPGVTENIYFAASNGHLDSLDAWIKAEPLLVTATNQQGETPMALALQYRRTNVVERLLAAGAPLDAQAAMMTGRSQDFLGLVDKDSTPSPMALGKFLNDSILRQDATVARRLIETGADLRVVGSKGNSSLYLARANLPEVVPLLEARGARENLFDAIAQTNAATVAALLKGDPGLASRNIPSTLPSYMSGAESPLQMAIRTGSPEIVRLLITAGAKMEYEDFQCRTALSLAAGTQHAPVVAELIKGGANLEPTDVRGFTPLHHAAMMGRFGATRLLLEHGANPNAQLLGSGHTRPTAPSTRRSGTAPLHLAALKGNTNVVALLLKQGAAINVTNNYGQTPLALVKGRVRAFGSMSFAPEFIPAVKDGEIRDRMIELLETSGGK